MVQEAADPTPWIERLPTDARGFRVPAEAGWDGGHPIFSRVSTERKMVLVVRGACAVCGYPLIPDRPVFRAFSQADAAHMRLYERERSHDPSGPLHLSCVLYSAIVCPYLRGRNARLGRDSDVNPGERRGNRAAVMGFEKFGLMMPKYPTNVFDPSGPAPMVAYLNLVQDIPYIDGRQLVAKYAEAAADEQAFINTGEDPLFWTDSAADEKLLMRALRKDFSKIRKGIPDYEQLVAGSGRFVVLTDVVNN